MRCDGGGRPARGLDSEQTGVRVGQIRGGRNGAGTGEVGLGETGETRRPLDVGLATEKRGQDRDLRLEGGEAGTGEGNDQRVTAGMADTLLTTEVLAGLGVQRDGGTRGSGDVLEELLGPFRQGTRGGPISDQGDVGLSVDGTGVGGDGVFIGVGLIVRRGRRVLGGTEAPVECNRVGGVESEGRGIAGDPSLLQLDNPIDFLIELVGWRAE